MERLEGGSMHYARQECKKAGRRDGMKAGRQRAGRQEGEMAER